MKVLYGFSPLKGLGVTDAFGIEVPVGTGGDFGQASVPLNYAEQAIVSQLPKASIPTWMIGIAVAGAAWLLLRPKR